MPFNFLLDLSVCFQLSYNEHVLLIQAKRNIDILPFNKKDAEFDFKWKTEYTHCPASPQKLHRNKSIKVQKGISLLSREMEEAHLKMKYFNKSMEGNKWREVH